jgi:hypothetical protein
LPTREELLAALDVGLRVAALALATLACLFQFRISAMQRVVLIPVVMLSSALS